MATIVYSKMMQMKLVTFISANREYEYYDIFSAVVPRDHYKAFQFLEHLLNSRLHLRDNCNNEFFYIG